MHLPARFRMVCFWMLLALTLLVVAGPCLATDHSNSNPFRSAPGVSTSSSTNLDSAQCLTVAEAAKQVGKKNCVRGAVVRVEQGHNGVTFLDFCADYHSCPFTVVVFRADLQSIGDVRQLQGRTITIQGKIQQYDARAEIVLRNLKQLGDSASHLTALPKDFDVERQGHASAGSFRPSKSKKHRHWDQDAPLSLEDPEVP